ncbi:unnamed protein product [Effrenium voratum]|nr:unnamed protein product [Effrenium voratum]
MGEDYIEGRLLDGFLLLAAGGSHTPDGVITVNLSSLQIVDIAEEDLSFFAQLHRVDLSDNQLGYEHILEQLARIPRLGNLNLACNSISGLQVGPNILQRLEVLDLSFNGLHGDVLGQLARLPSLAWLSLASNCISSLPPEEELQGLQVLEELILDSNDLVQFMQWRSLDAVPRLRKLSLVSNRVKRLKDDAPDTATGTTMSYFPSLEELDLSSNEITGVASLPVIQLFQNLRLLRLTENPLRGSLELGRVEVLCEEIKPFYMKGPLPRVYAFFTEVELIFGYACPEVERKEPKLKMDSRKMRKVSNVKQLAMSRPRSVSQLGQLDEEGNALVVKLGDTLDVPAMPAPAGLGGGILSDDLTEEELEQIFKDRRQTIEKRFEEPVDEPISFMREPEESSTKEKLSQLMRQMRQQEEGESGAPVATPKATGLFLTGLEEQAEPRRLRRVRTRSEKETTTKTPSSFEAFLASGGADALPPINQGAGDVASPLASPVPGLPDLRGVKKPVDASVKEALRALRAASMSERLDLSGLINAANWSFNDEQVFVLRKQILRAYRQLEAKKSQDAKNPPFKVYVYDEEEVPQLKPLLRSQIYCSRGQWGTDVQVHDYFVTSNCQTDDPKEADFFFVPGYAICVLEGNLYTLDEVDELYKDLVVNLPYFNASGGRDHIFVFGSGMAQSVFQSWEEYIPQAIALTPETELFNDFAWVAIPPYRPFKDIVIPGSLDLIEVIAALEKSKPLAQRAYLTAFFGRADVARGPHPWVGGVDVRKELLALKELPGCLRAES